MAARDVDDTLPDLLKAVEAILADHPKEKGIIHTRTFKIAKYIEDNLKDKRLLFHSSEDREEVINEHMKSKKPTVLVSPSSTEGLDLKDELSRFQIICKIHWPYLGDKLVKSRMEKYHHWYAYQAVKSLIQARGRSIRTADDYAVTYILDDAFERLYSKNIRMFPKYFRKSLHMDL
jgi:Rad3-related DNA helicase